jgi:signal transduction histidine kinase
MTPAPAEPARDTGRTTIRPESIVDVMIAVALAVLATMTASPERAGAERLALAIALVILPLLFRRRWPLAILCVSSVGALATALTFDEPWVQIASVSLASFTVGEREPDRTRATLGVLGVAVILSAGFIVLGAEPPEALLLTFVVVVPAWLVGDVIRGRRVDAARRAADIGRTIRESEARARDAAAEERQHVARELHDVVAHAVSVMVIQAGAARQVLRSAPSDAETALLAVESTGRDAMAELRRFLGALADEDEAGVAPQPGIGELRTLIDRVREAGLPASLEVGGMSRAVPPSLDVTAYRIVQEALTNALRYARQAATLVRISWEPELLRLEILDDGPGAVESEGSGRGLVGMRQRAALVGGRLEAGPRVGGGYAVRAWLPLDPDAAREGTS